MLVSLNTITGVSSGRSQARVILPWAYINAPLKEEAKPFNVSNDWAWSAIVISRVNLLSLIFVPCANPSWFSLTLVKVFLGLLLKEPSAIPSTPKKLPVVKSQASQYCYIYQYFFQVYLNHKFY